jgi:SAM-dependent methyltransferase
MQITEPTACKKYLAFDEERSCSLCGGREYAILSNKMQFRLDCRTVICKACGFCSVSPAPTKKAYDDFYKEAYATFYKKIHPDCAPLHTLKENAGEKSRLNLIERYKKINGSSILEIGPGNGRFISLVSLRGGKCSVVEPSKDYRRMIKGKGIEVVGDYLENVSADCRHDMIFMFQVLEHFRDPVSAIRKIEALLAENGILVLDVPNIWKPFRSLDRYFLRYVHLSYFSPVTLGRLLEGNGFEILLLDDGGGKRGICSPQSIFVIARPRQEVNSMELKDDGVALEQYLRRYQWKYRVLYAPLVYLCMAKREIRKLLSKSPVGFFYRIMKRFVNNMKAPVS